MSNKGSNCVSYDENWGCQISPTLKCKCNNYAPKADVEEQPKRRLRKVSTWVSDTEKELEEKLDFAAKDYALSETSGGVKYVDLNLVAAFKAGAKWQKEQDRV